jgi:signal transduction histidine kinase/ActR/RegA family two-component response regulator
VTLPSVLSLVRGRPIRQKVALLIAFSSAVGLGLAALAVLVYELTTSRPRALRDATTQAAIVRVNTIPALLFEDPEAATENLATLSSRREIGAAAIWRADGRLFASYRRPGSPPLPQRGPTAAGARFTGNQLVLAQPLVSDGEPIGWLTLQYEMPPLLQRLPQYGIMVSVVVLALGTAAILLLGMLGTGVSTPLARLTGTARSITASRDFRIRIPPGPPDEIGALTDAWNEMLGTIEQSQAALQSSELRLRLALEAAVMSTINVALQPPDRKDEAMATLLNGVFPEDRPQVERLLQQAIAERGRVDVEYREAGTESRWRALRGQVSPDGSRLMGVMQDVTQRRRLELQLLQAQKMEAIGNLAGGIAHDFNNLLTAIIGYLRFVQRGLPAGSQLRDDVDEAERAAQRAAELTSQLLSYARRQMVIPAVVDLRNAVHSLEPMLHRLLGEDVQVTVESSPDLWLTRIDPNQVGHVLVNLAVNARDAMPRGGKLRIGLSNAHLAGTEPELEDAELPGGDYVKLTVSDTGMGIAADVLPRIFEPFFTTKPVGSGTGLGLAMCYGVVRQANGTIWVTSKEGEGSTFTVLLPRTEAAAPQSPAPTGELDPLPSGSETILVAEDNEMVRSLAVRTLRGAGYNVLEADGGEAALECAEKYEGEIHLLLADVVMPGLSGPELAGRIRASRPTARVMFMSGYAEGSGIRRGMEEAKEPFISKPFTPGEIARAVRTALDRGAGRPRDTSSVESSAPERS